MPPAAPERFARDTTVAACAPAFVPSRLVAWLDRNLYPAYGEHWDDEIFRRRILEHLTRETRLLDVGAGAGFVRQMNFRGLAARVVGVDPDDRVRANPYLDEAHQGRGEALPFADASFDVAFSDNLLEHLDRPEPLFREVWRVLRPGGRYLVKTPNRKHYMPTIARLTPHGFHQWVNGLRGRPGRDTFPTRYRVNTPAELAAVAASAGFAVEAIDLIEGRPEYLRIFAPAYLAGWIYERAVNRIAGLRSFRILLVGVFVKPAARTRGSSRP